MDQKLFDSYKNALSKAQRAAKAQVFAAALMAIAAGLLFMEGHKLAGAINCLATLMTLWSARRSDSVAKQFQSLIDGTPRQ